MTDINKAISEVVELAMSKTILAFGDDDVSQIEPIKAETIAKIKALVVESIPPSRKPTSSATELYTNEAFKYQQPYFREIRVYSVNKQCSSVGIFP